MSLNDWTNVEATRKDHRCFGCEDTIPTGSPCVSVRQSLDGDFNAYRLCVPCVDFVRGPEFKKQFEDRYEQGDLRPWRAASNVTGDSQQ